MKNRPAASAYVCSEMPIEACMACLAKLILALSRNETTYSSAIYGASRLRTRAIAESSTGCVGEGGAGVDRIAAWVTRTFQHCRYQPIGEFQLSRMFLNSVMNLPESAPSMRR